MIIPGASLDVLSTYPPEIDLVSAMTALMRSAIFPHVIKSGTELRAKYAALDLEGAGSLDTAGLVSIWPLPQVESAAAPG